MQQRTARGFALVGMGLLGACGGRTSFLQDSNGAAAAGASSDVAGASSAPVAGASSSVGGFEQGGGAPDAFAGSTMVPPVSGVGGAPGGAGTPGSAGGGLAGAPLLVCGTGVRGGGYLNPCLAGSGGGSSGGCRAFDLIGAYWTGNMSDRCIEAVDDVSAATGAGIQRGFLGDLHTWSAEQFAETEDGLRVGAIGRTFGGQMRPASYTSTSWTR